MSKKRRIVTSMGAAIRYGISAAKRYTRQYRIETGEGCVYTVWQKDSETVVWHIGLSPPGQHTGFTPRLLAIVMDGRKVADFTK